MANKEVAKNTGFFGKIKGFFCSIGRFFKRTAGKLGKFIKEVIAEVKQLSWPSWKQLVNYCLAVICFCALMALIIWLLDLAFGNAIKFLAGLGK